MPKPSFKDPHAQREATRYDNPAPSREFLLDLIKEFAKPISHKSICQQLDLNEEQTEAVRRRLRAMARDGQLIQISKGRYTLVSQQTKIKGYILGHRDGFGFVVPHDSSDDIFLPYRQMRQVFDGDEVLVQIIHVDPHGKREGRIDEILQRNTQTIVGRLEQRPGHYVLISDNQRITQDIIVSAQNIGTALNGQFVVATITEQPSKHAPPQAIVSEVIGDHMAPGMETDIAIRTHNIPYVFSPDALKEAAHFDTEPTESDKQGRIDLRALPLITIDGEDARDFDDAVYCEKNPSDGWKLYVAIADVSHYVKPNATLDKEAATRGTSVYFPSRVVPMLPEALSNGLCSLKPLVDRLCMVCELNISAKGVVNRYQFYEAVMHSHARLTYTQVGAMLDAHNPDLTLRKQHTKILSHLEELHALYKVLNVRRKTRGAIEFETHETRIIFAADKKIESIVPIARNDAHKLIEECMLCANVAAAKFLEKHEIAGLYRVHDQPRAEKLDKLRKYLGELGLHLEGSEEPTPQNYQTLMAKIKQRPDHFVIQTMMLRSMNQANYQVENRGHFGLAYEAYTHFTSPIRRYPDLMVHRAIRNAIKSGVESIHIQRPNKFLKGRIKHYPYRLEQLIAIAEHSSLTERRADDASRDVESWLKCEYLQERVGDDLPGIITAVTSFGFFVELSNIYVEGLVHIKNLKDDFYFFDSNSQRLIGEHTRTVFRLGDSVEVRVASVNLDERKIDFELSMHVGITPTKHVNSKKPQKGKRASATPTTNKKKSTRAKNKKNKK